MRTKDESATLQELRRIYRDCPERVATYLRSRWGCLTVTTALLAAAFVLGGRGTVGPESCALIGALAGVAFGLGITFRVSSAQIQVLVRYATLRDDDVQRRLRELGEA